MSLCPYTLYSGNILGGRALTQLAQAPTQDYHSYTHALLGGVDEEVTSPNGSPVRWQENTELLSLCGLTGTPQRISLLGLGGKECSYGADVDGVRLPALPQAEAELFVCCVQRPCLAGQKKKCCCTNHPDLLPPVKQRQMKDSWRLRNQEYLHVLYLSQVAL